MNITDIQKEYEEIIVECILNFIRPEGIILYGGYGRNEGSWVFKNCEKTKTL